MVDKISSLLTFLDEIGAAPSKKLSQNFLIDKNIIKKIVEKAHVKEDDLILEIGPGPGALTREILKKCPNVIAVEKDKKFADYLSRNEKNVTIFQEDFLKFPLREILSKKETKAKVIANLPYHIASPIIAKLLENYDLFSEITIMIQYEMAKRLISHKDCKNYSAFTIFINFYSEPTFLFEISPNCFFPRPNVKSAIIQLKIKEPPKDIERDKFHIFVQKTFQQRRKKLTTILKNMSLPNLNLQIEEILKELKINPNARPENLTLEEFCCLYRRCFEKF
jgi:16S rRNA (adenine1518-N6/adenine1519-N6)-dimethyltransferase